MEKEVFLRPLTEHMIEVAEEVRGIINLGVINEGQWKLGVITIVYGERLDGESAGFQKTIYTEKNSVPVLGIIEIAKNGILTTMMNE